MPAVAIPEVRLTVGTPEVPATVKVVDVTLVTPVFETVTAPVDPDTDIPVPAISEVTPLEPWIPATEIVQVAKVPDPPIESTLTTIDVPL